MLTALLDGYQLTRRDEYLQLADRFVRQCSSPADDPDAMQLLDAEINWSYLMFLQAVGRFLDVLAHTNGRQSSRDYAAAVLLRYARWIAACERPFLDHAEALEYPTETWAATELRKVNVLLLAFKHAEPNPVFLERARFFHRRCFDDLRGFGEKTGYARPLAILMTNGLMFEYFRSIEPAQ